jgi:hypothetical protein
VAEAVQRHAKRLRPFLHHNPEIVGAVLRIFVRAIRTTLCRASPGAPRDALLGALSFLHRFGSSLNTHFHYHLAVLDGLFSGADDGGVQFHTSSQLTPAHWLELQRVVQRRVLRYFRTQGLLDEADANGMLTWRGSGGFSIDASVRIEGDDRAGIERLLRYCARPPFAPERLYAPAGIASLASNDSRLVYRLPRPAPDGRTELRLTPLELLERLARIRWAVLLARVYGVLPLLCTGCGGQMKILAFLTEPPVVSSILLRLDLHHLPPPLSPARGPPQGDFLFDQTPEFDARRLHRLRQQARRLAQPSPCGEGLPPLGIWRPSAHPPDPSAYPSTVSALRAQR